MLKAKGKCSNCQCKLLLSRKLGCSYLGKLCPVCGCETMEWIVLGIDEKDYEIMDKALDKVDKNAHARQARCKGVYQVKETGDIDEVNEILTRKGENWWIIDVGPHKPWFVLGRRKEKRPR